MAKGTVANVTAAKPATGGAVHTAALGTTLPTDAKTSLSSTTYTSMGYISADGLKNNITLTSSTVKAWGGDVVLYLDQGREDTYTLTFIEGLNPDVLALVHGEDNVSGTLSTGITVKINSEEQEARAWVIDMVMKDGALKRVCIPNAVITSIAEVAYNEQGAVGYQVTLGTLPDDDGQRAYEYIIAA